VKAAWTPSDEAPTARLQESFVLDEPSACALGTVAVGDAVGADDAHADFGTRFGDH